MGEFHEEIIVGCVVCEGTGVEGEQDCEECAGSGEVTQRIPIKWDTIKEIYRKAVEVCGAQLATPAPSEPSDNPIARIEAEQRAFEKWAISHGGLPLDPVGAGGCTKYGLFPATYWNDTTEVAWRAWANKPAPTAPSEPIKTWQERAAELPSYPTPEQAYQLLQGEIDELRAQLDPKTKERK